MLAAGLPIRWIDSATGDGVRDIRTPYGLLSYTLRKRAGVTSLTLTGRVLPPGGYVLRWPGSTELPARVRIDGQPATWTDRDLLIPAGARRIELC